MGTGAHTAPRAARARWRPGALILFLTALAARGARADELNGYLELTASRVATEAGTAAGPVAEQRVDSLVQRYYVNLQRRLFPNLQLLFGGLYERDASSFEVGATRSEARRRRVLPFLKLSLRSAPWLAEVAYDRRQEKVSAAGTSPESIQEVYRGTLGWLGETWPKTRLVLFRRKNFDADRQFLDTTVDTAQLTSDYRPVDSLALYYRGSFEYATDRIRSSEVETLFQSARVTYGDAWLDRRLSLSADYNVNHRRTETIAAGTGEVLFPLLPVAGLSSIDDTPDRDPLGANAALIDGDRTAPAGINLGLPPPGGDDRPRNLGLDLGSPTEVNTLIVWVDRELPPEIADAFSWRIYTSADNQDWTFQEALASAPFGPFDNRFELRFSGLTARYVKAVVSPLPPTAPFASSFPTIQITELEPAVTRRTQDLKARRTDVSQVGNLAFRARLLESTPLYYDLAYYVSKREASQALYTLTNGLSFSRPLGSIYTTAARVSRDDRREREGDVVAYLYSASLSAQPVETLRHNLVLSGTREDRTEGVRDTKSVILNSTAELYRGVDVNLGVGKSAIQKESGTVTDVRDVNFGTTLVPHRALTVNALYQDRTSRSRGTPAFLERGESRKAGEVGAAWRPIATLYLFVSRRIERSNLAQDRTLDGYALTFAPFPDGSLHLSLFYSETHRSDLDATERTFVPSARWDVTNRMFVQVSYQRSASDSILETLRTSVLSASFRASF